MNEQQPTQKLRFNASKPDGTVTTLTVDAGDVFSACVALVGPGRTVQLMDKDNQPIYRITVSETQSPDGPVKISQAPEGRE